MKSKILAKLCLAVWTVLAVTDAKDKEIIQLEPGTIGSGVAGIVRVLHNGQWGTVCHSSWDMPDAKVACRQLGFAKAEGYWIYGRGSGKVWLNYMYCTGSETSLHDCKAGSKWGSGEWCSYNHKYDVGVVCSGYVGPPQDNIQLEPGTIGTGVAGIVRVLHKGEWGTVCHSSWDMPDAKVACRQLGFAKAEGYWWFGRGSGKVWLNNMYCTGTETSLHDCKAGYKWGSGSWCSHTYDVGVVCSGYNVYLVDGGEPNEGRIEITYSGLNGTICNDGGWGMKESDVVCRMLGHEKAVKQKDFPQKSSDKKDIWLRDVSCKGCENTIEECQHPAFKDYKTECDKQNGKAAGVICLPKGKPNVTVIVKKQKKDKGLVKVTTHGIEREICADGWDIRDADVICRMATQSKSVKV